jgi:molybdopterin-guanine dinucleotide biosynthesis protein A
MTIETGRIGRQQPFSPPCSANLVPDPVALQGAGAVGQVVLAGGDGHRIGGAKPGRMLAGRSLLAHVCDGVAGPLAVAVRADTTLPEIPRAERIIDPPGLAGPLAALVSAFAWAQGRGLSWVQLRPCDAPFLPADLTHILLARAVSSGAPAVLPESLDRLHPACGLWHVSLLALAEERALSGRLSLIGLAHAADHASVAWQAGPGDDPFANINTPEDLLAAEARLSPRASQP